MSVVYSLREQWFGNVRGDILSGLLVALALIPEAIAFSIIAGVDPKVGLYASFCIAVITAIAGGRPGMISAATGVYEVKGQVFFADATQFANSFDYLHTPRKVVIDLTHAHFWDLSAVGALDRIVLKLRAHGAEVEVIGLNEASDTLIERVGKHRDENASLALGH